MGACFSSPSLSRNLLENVDGTEDDYHKRYLEDCLLGQGEFGTVKLVHDVSRPASLAVACKVLRKGVVFKDNVLLSPIKPHILKGEVDMLRELNGECYCLKLIAIYESSRSLFMVTEYCSGGQMLEYASQLDQELRTEDVSRIAFQLLSAVDHCSRHQILHRDIKPDNIMFTDPTLQAELRLIDFGSGCLDKGKKSSCVSDATTSQDDKPDDGLIWHTTYAGSAFYTSPELFQRAYTDKTDVWSVGVTLYVLVAGYPSDHLQKAFNIMQTNKGRTLRDLPNLPSDLPNSFYLLLEALLTYRHKQRTSAGQALQQEFVQFHKQLENDTGLSIDDIAAAAAADGLSQVGRDGGTGRSIKSQSMALSGTQQKHSLFLGFKRFERSLTALLATMLTKPELKQLLELLHERIKQKHSAQEFEMRQEKVVESGSPSAEEGDFSANHQALLVVRVNEMKVIIQTNFDNSQLIATMEKLPFAAAYGHFAYHVALLSDFADVDLSSVSGLQMRRNHSFSYLRKAGNAGVLVDSTGSRASAQSLVMLNKSYGASRRSENTGSRSLQGGNLFAKFVEGNRNNLN